MMLREKEELKTLRQRAHMVSLENRERASFTGVTDVESFNEDEVVMLTDQGVLLLSGEELHISRLNLEDGPAGGGGPGDRRGIHGRRQAGKEAGPVRQDVQIGCPGWKGGGARAVCNGRSGPDLSGDRGFGRAARPGPRRRAPAHGAVQGQGRPLRAGGAFFCGAALAAFGAVYRCNGGDLQAYTVLGMGVGWCLYLLSLSKALEWICLRLGRRLGKLAQSRALRSLFR